VSTTKPTQPSPIAAALPVRVFLVEDSPAVRELIVENLVDIPGLVFAGFSDTEDEALGSLRSATYDVVIFDIELRQGNGISLLRSLAATPSLPETLKIIFSNNVSSAYRRVGEQYGVRYFFDKTSELPKLRSLLEQVTQGATLG
jgi:DNA-binding NarL/FixJ family response regulator